MSRSQREPSQAYQIRLPKHTVRDLQILRVFGGVKVSDELRRLIVGYVESQRDRVQAATAETLAS